jgi:hypothetical protein
MLAFYVCFTRKKFTKRFKTSTTTFVMYGALTGTTVLYTKSKHLKCEKISLKITL